MQEKNNLGQRPLWYNLDKDSDCLTAAFVATGRIFYEGPGGVVDVLETQSKKAVRKVQPIVPLYDDFSIVEEYVYLDRSGTEIARRSYKDVLRAARTSEEAKDFVADYAQRVKDGTIYREYKVTEGEREWKNDDQEMYDFILALDVIRCLKGEYTLVDRKNRKTCLMPFIPVRGVTYTEKPLEDFREAYAKRVKRRSYIEIYFAETGREDAAQLVWADERWDENGQFLEKGPDGQMKPVGDSATKNHYETKETIKNYGDNKLTNPTKEYPNLEVATYSYILKGLSNCNSVFDQIRMLRTAYEQFIVIARVVLKSMKENKKVWKKWSEFLMLDRMFAFLPLEFKDFLILESGLTAEQQKALYDAENMTAEQIDLIIGGATLKIQQEAAELIGRLIERLFAEIAETLQPEEKALLDKVKDKILDAITDLDWEKFNELKRKKAKPQEAKKTDPKLKPRKDKEEPKKGKEQQKSKDPDSSSEASEDTEFSEEERRAVVTSVASLAATLSRVTSSLGGVYGTSIDKISHNGHSGNGTNGSIGPKGNGPKNKHNGSRPKGSTNNKGSNGGKATRPKTLIAKNNNSAYNKGN